MRMTRVLLAMALCLLLLGGDAHGKGAKLDRGRSARYQGQDLEGPIVVEFCPSENMRGRYYVDVKLRHKGKALHVRWWGTTSYADARAFAGNFVDAVKAKRVKWIELYGMFDRNVAGYRFVHAELRKWEESF